MTLFGDQFCSVTYSCFVSHNPFFAFCPSCGPKRCDALRSRHLRWSTFLVRFTYLWHVTFLLHSTCLWLSCLSLSL